MQMTGTVGVVAYFSIELFNSCCALVDRHPPYLSPNTTCVNESHAAAVKMDSVRGCG